MLLITSILPRRDGTVVAKSADGRKAFTFKPREEDGQLACDVDDPATVKQLLRTENFYPANDADFDNALALAGTAQVGGDDDDADDGDDSDDSPDDADDEGDPDGAPVESGTPPKSTGTRAPRTPRARS